VIRRFAARVLAVGSEPDLSWDEASGRLLLSAEACDHDFGDTIRLRVSDEVCGVLTLTDGEHGLVSWVSGERCADWGVTPERAVDAALRNQDRLIAGLRLQIENVDGHKLGMVPLDSPFKASVIFAPSFKDLVAADLGWPVWVVIPCRDFIYVVAEQSALVPRLGEVVVREFRESGYPITTEVLRVSSDGIEAVGTFPRSPG